MGGISKIGGITKRVKRAEEWLNLDREPVIHEIVHFGGTLPPEQRRGNVIIQHVSYESVRERMEARSAL